MASRVFKKITVYNVFTIDNILYCLFPQKLLKTTSTIQEACKQLGTKSQILDHLAKFGLGNDKALLEPSMYD